ncbi:alpha-ketoacid dehydrogenase subunit beta, partial [candidate division WOR-3 bacterium]|nr:alpha-ketoacid dehydrogenase subunit beta [candidate division WOR-3 bacterium]
GIINRGGEQAAQHSQALQAMFMHIPGLKVVMPSNPFDVKGLLISAIYDDNPVVFIDDRWLYKIVGDVPEEIYTVPIGKGAIRKKGKDITIVATGWMVQKAIESGSILQKDGIDVEIIDVRTLKPLDKTLIFKSVKKTGRLVVADAGWRTCGVAGEISALVTENIFETLKAPIKRIALPDTPAPMSSVLEQAYYPDADDIVTTVKNLFK